MEVLKEIRELTFDRNSPDYRLKVDNLLAQAAKFSDNSDYLKAGLLYDQCIHLTWGLDDKLLFDTVQSAVLHLDKVILHYPIDSIEGILALHCLNKVISNLFMFNDDTKTIRSNQIKIQEELAQRLIDLDSKHSNGKPSVNGLKITFQFDGKIEYKFPEHKLSGELTRSNEREITYDVFSAFDILMKLQDYSGCEEIIKKHSELFNSVELQGWKLAVKGWLYPENNSEYFKEASEVFSKYTHEYYEKHEKHKGFWTSDNVQLWAPYYKSLHFLCLAELESTEAIANIHRAANACKSDVNKLEPSVSRYKLMIEAISKCLAEPKEFDVELFIKTYARTTHIIGEIKTDEDSINFISNLNEVLQNFQNAPQEQLKKGGLIKIIEGLNHLPTIKDGQAKAIENAISIKALNLCQGDTSWIYRKLHEINDEDKFRKLLLRLMQALSPKFAQNIHGIVEHGRDILVLRKVDKTLRLELYQAKIGDIDTTSWRDIKQQLEEMMETDLPQIMELDQQEYEKIGYLVFTGHIKPIAEPKVSGWKSNRKTKMNEDYIIMHIDFLVNFIVDNRLVSEFREAVNEYKI